MCSNLTLAVVLAAYVPERRSLADARPDATDRDRGRVTRCPDSAAARLAHDGFSTDSLGRSPRRSKTPAIGGLSGATPRCELSAARSLVVVGAGHPFGGSLSAAFTVDSVAVLLCCTAPGVAVKPHGQSRGLRSLKRSGYVRVHSHSRHRSGRMTVLVSPGTGPDGGEPQTPIAARPMLWAVPSRELRLLS
jgi:hypothetical protein